jgi:hypothetical protein
MAVACCVTCPPHPPAHSSSMLNSAGKSAKPRTEQKVRCVQSCVHNLRVGASNNGSWRCCACGEFVCSWTDRRESSRRRRLSLRRANARASMPWTLSSCEAASASCTRLHGMRQPPRLNSTGLTRTTFLCGLASSHSMAHRTLYMMLASICQVGEGACGSLPWRGGARGTIDDRMRIVFFVMERKPCAGRCM